MTPEALQSLADADDPNLGTVQPGDCEEPELPEGWGRD